VQVKGSVALQTAFHVNINTYQHPTENRTFLCSRFVSRTTFRSAGATSQVWTTIYSLILLSKKSDYAAAHGITADALFLTQPPAPGRRLRSWAAIWRGLLWWNGATELGQNLGCSSMKHQSADLDHVFQERRSDEQCEGNPFSLRMNKHKLPGIELRTIPNRRST